MLSDLFDAFLVGTNSFASVDRLEALYRDPSFAIADDAFDTVSLDFSGDSVSGSSFIG